MEKNLKQRERMNKISEDQDLGKMRVKSGDQKSGKSR